MTRGKQDAKQCNVRRRSLEVGYLAVVKGTGWIFLQEISSPGELFTNDESPLKTTTADRAPPRPARRNACPGKRHPDSSIPANRSMRIERQRLWGR
jgi:hypothetical protein